ncbi:MAG TPA: hypothetical protein VE975_00900 [Actinomycetota bacterium]|nr:hypothetical protein [Actinomycetota bacterium]
MPTDFQPDQDDRREWERRLEEAEHGDDSERLRVLDDLYRSLQEELEDGGDQAGAAGR